MKKFNEIFDGGDVVKISTIGVRAGCYKISGGCLDCAEQIVGFAFVYPEAELDKRNRQ